MSTEHALSAQNIFRDSNLFVCRPVSLGLQKDPTQPIRTSHYQGGKSHFVRKAHLLFLRIWLAWEMRLFSFALNVTENLQRRVTHTHTHTHTHTKAMFLCWRLIDPQLSGANKNARGKTQTDVHLQCKNGRGKIDSLEGAGSGSWIRPWIFLNPHVYISLLQVWVVAHYTGALAVKISIKQQ